MVNTTSGYFLFSELGLVFGDDFEGVQDACQGGLGPNSLNRILVEDVVNPRDLRDLVGRTCQLPSATSNRLYRGIYRCEVSQASSRVRDQIVDILLLINESIMPTKTEVGGDIPGNYAC